MGILDKINVIINLAVYSGILKENSKDIIAKFKLLMISDDKLYSQRLGSCSKKVYCLRKTVL